MFASTTRGGKFGNQHPIAYRFVKQEPHMTVIIEYYIEISIQDSPQVNRWVMLFP
jgi:hypothetical protein